MTKAALIIAGAILISAGVQVYYSQHMMCIREGIAPRACVLNFGPR
ncbi:hypothetical protein GGQ68_002543 [Sagittula marina]|uniref:Uncharacterized protein n=1 Tax=Sagittula marina TaxID=943940 RepID=A0A7W6DT24_9RHOB|nr:hypothetical protein [Sagittula marina]